MSYAEFLNHIDEFVGYVVEFTAVWKSTGELWWNCCHWDSPMAIYHSYDVESEDNPYAVGTVVGYAAKCLKPRIRRRYV